MTFYDDLVKAGYPPEDIAEIIELYDRWFGKMQEENQNLKYILAEQDKELKKLQDVIMMLTDDIQHLKTKIYAIDPEPIDKMKIKSLLLQISNEMRF